MSQSSDAKWNVLFALSLALLAGSAYAGFIMKRPLANAAGPSKKDLAGLTAQTRKAHAEINAARKQVAAQTWTISLESLDSLTLDTLTKLAEARHLQLITFITGRPTSFGTMQETPFKVHVEGQFLNVMAFLANVESASSRLAVDLLQINAKNGATDEVAAEIGLVAFVVRGKT